MISSKYKFLASIMKVFRRFGNQKLTPVKLGTGSNFDSFNDEAILRKKTRYQTRTLICYKNVSLCRSMHGSMGTQFKCTKNMTNV